MNPSFRILGTIAGWLFLLTVSTAARLPPLTVESAAFPGAGARPVLEIYLLVPSGEGAGGKDPDPRLLQVAVKRPGGTRLGESSRVVQGSGSSDPQLSVWRFPVVPGKLQVQVQVLDMNRRVLGDAEPVVWVPNFAAEGLGVSTPVFGILPAGGSGSPAGLPQRGGILPVSGRRVTGEKDTVAVYLLVGGKGDSLATSPASEGTPQAPSAAEIVDIYAVLRRGTTVESRDSVRVSLEPIAEYVFRQPVSGLADEEYHLELRVRRGGIEVLRELAFRVAVGGRELLSDPTLLRTVLGYVATREERLEWESAPEDSFPPLWARFWARRDPSLGTDRNEARDLFVERVQEAGRRFGGIVPGWRTDRGRIYIRHGEPERVDRILPHGSSPATETWFYGGDSPSYVFQDAEGYGDFQLTGGARD